MGGVFWLLHPSQSCTEHVGRGAEITRSVGLALRVEEAPRSIAIHILAFKIT